MLCLSGWSSHLGPAAPALQSSSPPWRCRAVGATSAARSMLTSSGLKSMSGGGPGLVKSQRPVHPGQHAHPCPPSGTPAAATRRCGASTGRPPGPAWPAGATHQKQQVQVLHRGIARWRKSQVRQVGQGSGGMACQDSAVCSPRWLWAPAAPALRCRPTAPARTGCVNRLYPPRPRGQQHAPHSPHSPHAPYSPYSQIGRAHV